MSQFYVNGSSGGGAGVVVSFQAQRSTALANQTGDGTNVLMVYNQVNWNLGGGYNNATGIFTAPVAGIYAFSGTISLTNLNVNHTQLLSQVTTTSGITYNAFEVNPFNMAEVNTNLIVQYTCAATLAVGGTARVQVSVNHGTKTVGLGGSATFALNLFTGYLIK
jgi:hypothetical protein